MELAPSLPLREEIRQSLLGADLPERSLHEWLVRHEHGDWAACDAIVQMRGLKQKDLVRCFDEAVVWAEAALDYA